MEPRAGFDPATNSLQGCRSTGLSHRGIYLKGLLFFYLALTYRFSVSNRLENVKIKKIDNSFYSMNISGEI